MWLHGGLISPVDCRRENKLRVTGTEVNEVVWCVCALGPRNSESEMKGEDL